MSFEVSENAVSEEKLKEGAKKFEMFWLRTKKMSNEDVEVVLRMRINKKWGGWKLKDEVVESVGLEIGDTINTEVSILYGPGLIADSGDTDLFASGEGADWLLENEVSEGSVIDAKVKFIYSKAPVGGTLGKEIWKLSLVLVKGYSIVQKRSQEINQVGQLDVLKKLLENS